MLSKIEDWVGDFERPSVFWLNGLAGTGKTTIAQTTAKHLFANGHLGASFFCSRSVEDHSDLQLIFPTLAFQLAQKYPNFRSSLIPLLRFNPDVVHESLQDQMQKFLVEPLQSANVSTVIVIDALDECRDEATESAILLVLGQSVSEIPGVKFFIISRPENYIVLGFRGPLLEGSTEFGLHTVDHDTINKDIHHFFKHELSKLPPSPDMIGGWPTDEQLDFLCKRAAGFFIYAVAIVNFLSHNFRDPSSQLAVIMKPPRSTVHESRVKLKNYASLDSLYMSILQAAFVENSTDDKSVVRSILSAIVLTINPLTFSAIATLMDSSCYEVQHLLKLIPSLLVLPEDSHSPIHTLHQSFSDFIMDPTRCTNPQFHISPDYHIELVLHCLRLMGKVLERNMCSLPDYVLNSEIEDLSGKIKKSGIHGALEYACRSWHKHLIMTNYLAADVVSALHCLLEKKFLFWLEVLSVLGSVGEGAQALKVTIEWLKKVCPD